MYIYMYIYVYIYVYIYSYLFVCVFVCLSVCLSFYITAWYLEVFDSRVYHQLAVLVRELLTIQWI